MTEEQKYLTRITECVEDMAKWMDEKGYLDVIFPACATILASSRKVESLEEASKSIMFYLAYSHVGPALISVDYDITPFLEACDSMGVEGLSYYTPVIFNKRLDMEVSKDDTITNKQTIH